MRVVVQIVVLSTVVRAQYSSSCACEAENFPCSLNGGCYSHSTQSSCEGSGGTFCNRAPCNLVQCATCVPDGSTCATCAPGYVNAPTCETEESFFSDVTAQLLPGSGVVALVSPRLHALLTSGFADGSRGTATTYVAQAFLRLYQDVFKLVYVFPHNTLSGSTHQQFFSSAGLGGSSTYEGAVISGNLPIYSGNYLASMHELSHNYVSPSKMQQVFPDNFFGVHWGFTGFPGAAGGMLGGFPSSAITCADPAGLVPSPSASCNTNDVRIDASTGSPETSNDLSNTAFPNVEQYLMGLLTADELRTAGGHLILCNIQNQGADTSYDSSTTTISATCLNGVQFKSMDEVIAASPQVGPLMTPSATTRAAVVVVYPSASSIPANAAAFSARENWVTRYYSETLPPIFATATNNRQTINFDVTTADRRAGGAAPSPPAPPSPPVPSTPPGTTISPPPPPPPPFPPVSTGPGAGLVIGLVAAGLIVGLGALFGYKHFKARGAQSPKKVAPGAMDDV